MIISNFLKYLQLNTYFCFNNNNLLLKQNQFELYFLPDRVTLLFKNLKFRNFKMVIFTYTHVQMLASLSSGRVVYARSCNSGCSKIRTNV